VLVGVPTPEMTVELPLQEVFGRGGALKSSWYGDCLPSRDFPLLIDLFLQGRFDLGGFVTERIPLDGVEEAFARMHRGEVLRSSVVIDLASRSQGSSASASTAADPEVAFAGHA
jgi:S-(hydroxymethyl)mycothiol dehydrogenase